MTRSPRQTEEDWALTLRVLRYITEFNLVRVGGFTYQDLGYVTATGQVPAWVVRRHLLLASYYASAWRDKTP